MSSSRRYRLYLAVFRCRFWGRGRGRGLQLGFYPTRAWRLWLRRGVWPRSGAVVIFRWWSFGPLQVRRFGPQPIDEPTPSLPAS